MFSYQKIIKMANLPGQKPENIRLSIKGCLEVELLNYGASLKSIRVPVGDELIVENRRPVTDAGGRL